MNILQTIDRISISTSKIVKWLALILSATVLFEVGARYLFGRPTLWAFDVTMFLYSAFFMLGAAWVLQEQKHIRIDVFYNMLPKRGRAIVDIFFYLLFFFPLAGVMIWYGTQMAYDSWLSDEISNTSQWGEKIYLWRAIIPVSFFLLFLQGIAEFIRTLNKLWSDKHGS